MTLERTMKILKFTGLSLITVTATVLTISSAYAASKMEALNNTFKVAIIKDAPGAKEFAAGRYQDAIISINAGNKKSTSAFDRSMGLCVAHMKISEFSTAKENCSDAIAVLSKLNKSNHRAKYLTSIAYSNRAIVNYLNGDNSAAAIDFSQALLFDTNKVVKHNLSLLTNKARVSANQVAKYDETLAKIGD